MLVYAAVALAVGAALDTYAAWVTLGEDEDPQDRPASG